MTRSEQQRWALGEWVKAHPRRGWFPYSISLERRQTVSAYGQRWRIRHRVEAMAVGLLAFAQIEPLKALRAGEERQLRKEHVFTNIGFFLRDLGYSGGWHVDEQITGFWRRPLPDAHVAYHELAFLDGFRLQLKGKSTGRGMRRVNDSIPSGRTGAPQHVAAAWQLFELAKKSRPRDCSLRVIGFQRLDRQLCAGRSWHMSLALYAHESRLSAHITPASEKLIDKSVDDAIARKLKNGFHALKLEGSWHPDDARHIGFFDRDGAITPERFSSEQAFLESIRLTDVMKLGTEPEQRSARTRGTQR